MNDETMKSSVGNHKTRGRIEKRHQVGSSTQQQVEYNVIDVYWAKYKILLDHICSNVITSHSNYRYLHIIPTHIQ